MKVLVDSSTLYSGIVHEGRVSELLDAPILAAAMQEEVDYLLTSDKELQDVDVDGANVLDVAAARDTFL